MKFKIPYRSYGERFNEKDKVEEFAQYLENHGIPKKNLIRKDDCLEIELSDTPLQMQEGKGFQGQLIQGLLYNSTVLWKITYMMSGEVFDHKCAIAGHSLNLPFCFSQSSKEPAIKQEMLRLCDTILGLNGHKKEDGTKYQLLWELRAVIEKATNQSCLRDTIKPFIELALQRNGFIAKTKSGKKILELLNNGSYPLLRSELFYAKKNDKLTYDDLDSLVLPAYKQTIKSFRAKSTLFKAVSSWLEENKEKTSTDVNSHDLSLHKPTKPWGGST